MRMCRAMVWGALMCGSLAAHADVDRPYRFERGDRYFKDVVQLNAGGMHLGKVLEWADRVLVYGIDGTPITLDAADVAWIEVRRDPRLAERDALPDLTVVYVERLPRATSWHGNVSMRTGVPTPTVDGSAVSSRPTPGQNVTFRVHVLNAGNQPSSPVACDAAIDGKSLGQSVKLPAIEAGGMHVAEFTWQWSDDASTLEIDIDKGGAQAEWLRWNNHFVEPIQALSVVVAVPRRRYEAFRQSPNLVDSFCFEDYAQYHVRSFNGLLAASKHDTSPGGVLERLRLDRVVVVDDDVGDGTLRKQFANGRGLAEYDALVVMGDTGQAGDRNPLEGLRIDWSAMQRLGLELGLVDTSVFQTRLRECGVYDKFGRPAIVQHVPTDTNSIMFAPGPTPLTAVEAAYLNRVRGMPRGLSGTYLNQVPERVVIDVVGANGAPIPGVSIDVFQLSTDDQGNRTIAGPSGTDPWVATATDESGRAQLPNRPCASGETPDGYSIRANPFGEIRPDGSNGLLLLRLRQGDGRTQLEAFHFLSLTTCNAAYLNGQTKEYVHRIATQFDDANAVVPRLPYAFSHMPERSTPKPDLTVAWTVPSWVDLSRVGEYRLYRRIGFGGSDTSPWTLVAMVPQRLNASANNQCPQPYFNNADAAAPGSMDTWFAISIADQSGREGAMSEPAFLPYGKQCHKLAIKGNAAYMTLSGDGPPIMLYFDAVAGTQAYLPRTSRFPGYEPHYEGIAFGQKGMIVTDPVNHVLAVYDTTRGRHELIETIPSRDAWPGPASFFNGEFHSPADIASDAKGNLYVADRGNHRVQILGPDGRFKALLDPDFRFDGPHAIAYSFGRICVTDKAGTRVRVYDVRGDAPKFSLELPPLMDADRALVTIKELVVVTGRRNVDDQWALQVFKPKGEGAEYVETMEDAVMGKCYAPRGLYQHPTEEHMAYFVNSFPFDVRIVTIGIPPGGN